MPFVQVAGLRHPGPLAASQGMPSRIAAWQVPVVAEARTQMPPPEHSVNAPLMTPHGDPGGASDTFTHVPVAWPIGT